MIIMGLHFGHDASVTILKDGIIASHVLRERQVRRKHAVGLTNNEIATSLISAGVNISEIDLVALVSTQDIEIITGLIDGFDISFDAASQHPVPGVMPELLARAKTDVQSLLSADLRKCLGPLHRGPLTEINRRWRKIFPEWESYLKEEISSVGWLDRYVWPDIWKPGRGIADIESQDFQRLLDDETLRQGLHYPVTVTLDGCSIPGAFVDHHVCHAASAYYRSGFESAGILTLDGGDASRGVSGLLAYGEENRIRVISPHHLFLGGLYRAVGFHLGFDMIGAEGKLMGLAPYGKPRFFHSDFVGNVFDIKRLFENRPLDAWMSHCLSLAREKGYSQDIGNPHNILNRSSVDIASSTQRLFEETYLRAAQALDLILARSGRAVPRLCISGGCALNCPSNGRLLKDGAFDEMFIEPNCDDGGLSTGAALYLYHNLLDHPISSVTVGANASPYQGPQIVAQDLQRTLAEAAKEFVVERPQDVAQAAASDLAANKVLAWFEGRSEVGPRALCHRSILANPSYAENWQRVNAIKGREGWRPFAPAVLEEDQDLWFRGAPSPSPYMLFTAVVKTDDIPAVTHVDGTSRIQTVKADTGVAYRLLKDLKKRLGVAVVLNTSLNGPGEPIIETPRQAVDFFRKAEVDVLYLEGRRISRRL
jgi:carbamoyltransferase